MFPRQPAGQVAPQALSDTRGLKLDRYNCQGTRFARTMTYTNPTSIAHQLQSLACHRELLLFLVSPCFNQPAWLYDVFFNKFRLNRFFMTKISASSIAVVSLCGVFPGANGKAAFWRNVTQGVDTTIDVPAGRWIAPPDWVYNKTPEPDKAYARRACMIQDFTFDPAGLSLDEKVLMGLDPLHQWVLHAARQAMLNCQTHSIDKNRMGVILAAIALPTDVSSLLSRRFLGNQILYDHTDIRPSSSISQSEALTGRVVSTPAALVSRGLGLGGGSYTLDAACASSLYAIKLACDELQAYRADAMMAGGVSHPDCLYTQIGFSQLQALSKSGRCAPFDATADGLVVGEGAGILVLKRLEDAVRDADTIYGVIRGIGLSNDMRGNLLAPESAGQLRAMQMAYAQAEWHPHDVDHIECHGAGTPVGDATEIASLHALWGQAGWQPRQCAIGSVKSMIGHLLTAAGAAGMIKSLLALHHKTLPPSLKFNGPSQQSLLSNSPFRVQTEPEPWPRQDFGKPRRAAVSAFGFGGINAHVLLEEWRTDDDSSKKPSVPIEITKEESLSPSGAMAIVGLDLTLGPLNSLKAFQQAVFTGQPAFTQPPRGRWKAASAIRQLFGDKLSLGGYIQDTAIEIGEFQIPPGEIPDILPQQLLMLKVAAGAMGDAQLPLRKTRERMGAIIGIGFDYEASNFHLRWALAERVRTWQNRYGLKIDENRLDTWLQTAREGCGPPLTATRTLGALGGIVASRIAREFRFGGPSFVVSAQEASGLRALEISTRMLQNRQVDAMLVGAVDLACDERNLATFFKSTQLSSSGQVRPFDQSADGTLPGEGAVALVLKRLEDAHTDNDRIYAVVEGIGSASGGGTGIQSSEVSTYCTSMSRAFENSRISPASVSLVETHGSGISEQDEIETQALHRFFASQDDYREHPMAIGTLKPLVGHTGATSGLASVAKTALSLFHELIPPSINYTSPGQDLWKEGRFYMPHKTAYWSHNRSEGSRAACVAAMTPDGHNMHVVLSRNQNEAAENHSMITPSQRKRPMGPISQGLFILRGSDSRDLLANLESLEKRLSSFQQLSPASMENLAHQWYRPSEATCATTHTLSIVAESPEALGKHLHDARLAVEQGIERRMNGRGGVCYLPDFTSPKNELAFVYPGSGNHYVGMGRTLGAHWPEVLQTMDAATDQLQTQLLPQWYDPWRHDWRTGWQQEAYEALVAHPLHTIFGQVLFGGQMTGLLRQFNLGPQAVIGYSLGESAGLFAMGAWPDRGRMLERLVSSDLFKTQLAGPCQSMGQAWQLPDDLSATWQVAAVNRSARTVDAAIAGLPWVRRLIVNTPHQCVIGGVQTQVVQAIENMKCEAVILDGVVTVHCDAAQPSAEAYKDLHRFPTRSVQGIRFYSCAFEKAYNLTSESAAESIVQQALQGFDFPRTIEKAHGDGARIFLEVGPNCSCTRMIDQILVDKPHLALAANKRGENECLSLIKCLGTIAAAGLAVNLDLLYGYDPDHMSTKRQVSPNAIRVPVGGQPLSVQLPPLEDPVSEPVCAPEPAMPLLPETEANLSSMPQFQLELDDVIKQFNENVTATAQAHEQFLQFSQDLTSQYGETVELQARLMASMNQAGIDPATVAQAEIRSASGSVAFSREACMEFAIGSVGKILGPQFDIIDTYKARVRLPDEPLMLVDRILRVEGKKCSLGSGRVVTEHDVQPDAWYLDGQRAPVCISVEAGQADLFLCAYLGIDHQVKGKRTYRLLDAKIRFHRGLPRPGETIRYDIHIDKFVRQEATYLFFFRFEGHIGDEHLITMTNGCAGFFTDTEVRNSGGIILTDEDRAPGARINGTPYKPLLPLKDESYNSDQIEALRNGDAAGCFGPAFQGIQLPPALCLPKGRMQLMDRIIALEPKGGRFGLGYVKAEADIHPDDWFLACHFVDDMVMPGTLMYECCAHTLRVLLLRLGWVTDKAEVCYEPVQAMDCSLKCRGPVTPQTRHVHYAVEIKEMGYHPEPYVIADAHMYADDHYIVFFKDMSMQMTGVISEDIASFWDARRNIMEPQKDSPQEPLFTSAHILEFAVGRPSKAFGQPYEVFDRQRRIARLPGPPYCFIDRITAIQPKPWVLEPDGWVQAQYDMPAKAWYFGADRSGEMPFCVLLEIALQPCGWLAAYAGSALKSEKDLKFRNLGGEATMQANLTPGTKTLTMRTRMTKVSEAADMIIENFEFEVLNGDQPVYSGHTYFGFFTSQALSKQVGLREEAYAPDAADLSSYAPQAFADHAPITPDEVLPEVYHSQGLAMPAKALLMIDGIEYYSPNGGPHGLGFIRGYKIVDPEEWFFKAHFYQDPVCPGSLGIESFLQLLKYAALERWPHLAASHEFRLICHQKQQWDYRGQVIPTNEKVLVDGIITHLEEGESPMIMADGWLQVDGIFIYKMQGFGYRLVPKNNE